MILLSSLSTLTGTCAFAQSPSSAPVVLQDRESKRLKRAIAVIDQDLQNLLVSSKGKFLPADRENLQRAFIAFISYRQTTLPPKIQNDFYVATHRVDYKITEFREEVGGILISPWSLNPSLADFRTEIRFPNAEFIGGWLDLLLKIDSANALAIHAKLFFAGISVHDFNPDETLKLAYHIRKSTLLAEAFVWSALGPKMRKAAAQEYAGVLMPQIEALKISDEFKRSNRMGSPYDPVWALWNIFENLTQVKPPLDTKKGKLFFLTNAFLQGRLNERDFGYPEGSCVGWLEGLVFGR